MLFPNKKHVKFYPPKEMGKTFAYSTKLFNRRARLG